MNEKVRLKVMKDHDFCISIEGYMFEEHQMLRRAAVQCFTNLCVSPIMVERCEGKNEKVLFILPRILHRLLCSKCLTPIIITRTCFRAFVIKELLTFQS